jgi:hypothetical protein
MSRAAKRQAAPRALPAPTTPPPAERSSIAGIIRALIPPRAAEDVMAERVPVTLGDRSFILPVLSIEANETWTALFNQHIGSLLSGMERPDANAQLVLGYLQGLTPIQLELLRAYDSKGVLPDDEWIRANASGPQLLKALLGTVAAAFPFAIVAIEMVLSSQDVQGELLRSLQRYTSSLPANGAGQPATSGVN